VFDTNEEIGLSNRYLNFDEAISKVSLAAGDYFVQVQQFSGDTHYRLGLTTTGVNSATSGVDLKSEFRSVTAPDIRLSSDAGQAQIVVTNAGNLLGLGNVRVNLYASTNQTYDGNDELLASQTLSLNLATGQAQLYTLNFGAPTGVAPGSYYLLARIDTTNAIAESNENNNLAIQHISAPGTDVVLDWNATLLNVIQAVETSPPLAARNQAMVQAAIYDAVNAIDQRYRVYQVSVPRNIATGAAAVAAAAQAAYQVLVDLYPSQRAEFVAQLARSLAEVADGVAKTNGIAVGQYVADRILAHHLSDGATGAQDRYIPGNRPGDYQFTRPDNFALLPGWGNVTPFVLPNVSDFVPAGPPAFGSHGYATELNEVQRLGGINSAARTPDQSDIAVFWAYDRPDTFRPPAQWNQIAQTIAMREGTSLLENARLFAQLNLAQADAGMVAWQAKYTHNQLRPITAVRQADFDDNAQTIGNPNWQSWLPTPPFPDYISGHSTFGAAAATVLEAYFGTNYAFDVSSQEIAGTYRSFTSFQQAAEENGISRIYGGVHIQAANRDGITTGQSVANYVLRNALTVV
jgi:membrane-associated phospholipid phosphatase